MGESLFVWSLVVKRLCAMRKALRNSDGLWSSVAERPHTHTRSPRVCYAIAYRARVFLTVLHSPRSWLCSRSLLDWKSPSRCSRCLTATAWKPNSSVCYLTSPLFLLFCSCNRTFFLFVLACLAMTRCDAPINARGNEAHCRLNEPKRSARLGHRIAHPKLLWRGGEERARQGAQGRHVHFGQLHEGQSAGTPGMSSRASSPSLCLLPANSLSYEEWMPHSQSLCWSALSSVVQGFALASVRLPYASTVRASPRTSIKDPLLVPRAHALQVSRLYKHDLFASMLQENPDIAREVCTCS